MEKTSRYKFSGRKKGLSTIVTTVILIAISLLAVALVWAFVNSMIKNQITQSQSCFGNYDKVKFNRAYTCYYRIGSTSNYNYFFSIEIGDVKVDKVLVLISSSGTTQSYQINNSGTIDGLKMYPSDSDQIVLPNRNAGLTYNATGFTAPMDSIQIAPVISGTVCEVSDSVSELEPCSF